MSEANWKDKTLFFITILVIVVGWVAVFDGLGDVLPAIKWAVMIGGMGALSLRKPWRFRGIRLFSENRKLVVFLVPFISALLVQPTSATALYGPTESLRFDKSEVLEIPVYNSHSETIVCAAAGVSGDCRAICQEYAEEVVICAAATYICITAGGVGVGIASCLIAAIACIRADRLEGECNECRDKARGGGDGGGNDGSRQ